MKLASDRLIGVIGILTVLVMMNFSHISSAQSVTFWTQSSTDPWLVGVIKDFTEETGIEVDIRHIGFGVDELYVAYAAGVMPDLFTHGGAALGTLAHQGIMDPMDKVIEHWSFAEDIIPVIFDIGRYQGRQVGMAWKGLTVDTLVYHADIFEEVGLSADDPPVHWDELVDVGRKLVVRDESGRILRSGLNIRDTGTAHGPSGMFRLFTLQSGLDPFGDELESISLLDERIVSAVTFYSDLFNRHRLNDRGVTGSLGNRTTAMSYGSPSVFVQFPDEAEHFRVTLHPYNKVPIVGITGDFISLSSGAASKPEAVQLLTYLLHPDTQYKISKATGFLPIFREGIWWDWVQEMPAYNEFIDLMMQYGHASTPHAKFFEIRDFQTQLMLKALNTDPHVVLEAENRRFLTLMGDE